MKPIGSGLKKGRRSLRTKDVSATAQKPIPAQFKLRASRLVTKKQPNLEMKPKAVLLTSTGVGLPTEQQRKAKPSVFMTNSFIRPVSTGDAPKKSSGLSFMKFQPMPGKLATEKNSFANKTPFIKKFSIGSLSKTSDNLSGESGSTSKETSHKPQGKSALPFAFRTTSAEKKRKAESPANEGRKSGFPSKIGRGNSSFALRSPAQRNAKGKQPVWSVQRETALQDNTSFTTKIDRVEVNNGNVLKKRSLLETMSTSAPKRRKLSAQVAVGELGDSTKVARGADADTSFGDEDLPSPPIPSATREQTPSPKADSDPAKNVQLTRLSSSESPSPGRNDDCLNEIGEFLAMKRFCSLDDDKEDGILTRAAVVQEFTDHVRLEQKQFRTRLLDAHADVSETLLDALTVLLAEEGGVGIDKLDFDMDIDVDVGNAFLQENDIQDIQ